MDSTPPDKAERSHPRFGTITARLIIAFSLLFLGVMMLMEVAGMYGLPLTGFEGEISSRLKDAFRDLDLIADLKEERILRLAREWRADLDVLSQYEAIREDATHTVRHYAALGGVEGAGDTLWGQLREDPGYARFSATLERVSQLYGIYYGIFLADARTGIIVAGTSREALGHDLSEETFFRKALEFDRVYLTDVATCACTGRQALHFARAVRPLGPETPDTASEPIAVLILEIDPYDILGPVMHTGEALGRTGEALLVNEAGIAITSLRHALVDGSRPDPLEHRITALPADRAARGERGRIETGDYRHEPVLAVYRHVRVAPSWGWGLVVKQDRAELLAPVREKLKRSSLIAVLGMILLIGIATLIASRLTRPILALSRAAGEVAAGNLGARAPVDSSDEVGTLAITFNEMAERVELSHHNLEEQVARRTVELEQANVNLTSEVTVRRAAETSLADANRELAVRNDDLEALIYAVSHDLRSPLVNIQGFSRELKLIADDLRAELESFEPPPRQRDRIRQLLDEQMAVSLSFIQSGTDRMDGLLAGLLRFSRIGRAALSIEPLDMHKLVDDLLRAMDYQIKATGARVTVGDLPPCMGDLTQTTQVFANLIDNAVKYLDPERPGAVRIAGRREDSHVVYTIEDNGIGITPEHRDHIFGIFHRIAPDKTSGEGLGLTIAKRAVSRQNGTIDLESEPGQGTVFRVQLPAVPEPADQSGSAHDPGSDHSDRRG